MEQLILMTNSWNKLFSHAGVGAQKKLQILWCKEYFSFGCRTNSKNR